jgi:hypothetical protein
MRRALLKVHPIVWALIGIGLVMLAITIPGLSAENERQRRSEIHVCEMSKVMAGTDVDTAELLCERGWER